jgi:hypothetical protein
MQKHREFLGNPFAEFGTFPATNSLIQVAQKVRPSGFRNHLGERLRANATIQANV